MSKSKHFSNHIIKILQNRIALRFFKQSTRAMATLESLRFDNKALRSLPLDPEKTVYVRQVAGACFSRVKPTPVDNPQVVAVSLPALSLIGLSQTEAERPEFAEYFCGNKILPGSETAAHCYCGHQFGYFSGQLGDGAAMYLGEILNEKGERWEIQLKGAGKTPYSRQADGRKVLRSSIREFLCSEAIHHLGIPTTRAGSCVTSDTTCIRDIFYNGNAINEKCTNVLRIAPSFIRFGSFEIFKTLDPDTGRVGPSVGQKDILHQLLKYTIETLYPEIWQAHKQNQEAMYVEFYKEVVRRTARLVADWQCVGWCHGVLNTDNMSIVGVTIDYGPFGFMDAYDPGYICNGSDDHGRYSYEKQPSICRWNCEKLAEAIKDAVSVDLTKPHLNIFDEEYKKHYMAKIRKKFGLLKSSLPEDKDLINSFLDTMFKTGADFTNSFRCLNRIPLPGSEGFEMKLEETKQYLVSQCSTVEEMKRACKPRMNPRQLQMLLMLMQSNPDLANQLGSSQRSFMREIEKLEKIEKLKEMSESSKQAADEVEWSKWLKQYTDRLARETENVTDINQLNEERVKVMNQNNPRFILRNYIAQNAIKAAEDGDFSEVQRVLKLLEQPYNEEVDLGHVSQVTSDVKVTEESASQSDQVAACSTQMRHVAYDSKPPEWASDLIVT